MKTNIKIILLLSLITLVGCSKKYADCISERNQKLKIRWGEIIHSENTYSGYMLNAKGELFLITRVLPETIYETKKIGNTKNNDYCELMKLSQRLFLQTPVLNSPSQNISHFIELENKNTNLLSRGIWNPDFDTDGNKKFRQLYEQLMTIVN